MNKDYKEQEKELKRDAKNHEREDIREQLEKYNFPIKKLMKNNSKLALQLVKKIENIKYEYREYHENYYESKVKKYDFTYSKWELLLNKKNINRDKGTVSKPQILKLLFNEEGPNQILLNKLFKEIYNESFEKTNIPPNELKETYDNYIKKKYLDKNELLILKKIANNDFLASSALRIFDETHNQPLILSLYYKNLNKSVKNKNIKFNNSNEIRKLEKNEFWRATYRWFYYKKEILKVKNANTKELVLIDKMKEINKIIPINKNNNDENIFNYYLFQKQQIINLEKLVDIKDYEIIFPSKIYLKLEEKIIKIKEKIRTDALYNYEFYLKLIMELKLFNELINKMFSNYKDDILKMDNSFFQDENLKYEQLLKRNGYKEMQSKIEEIESLCQKFKSNEKSICEDFFSKVSLNNWQDILLGESKEIKRYSDIECCNNIKNILSNETFEIKKLSFKKIQIILFILSELKIKKITDYSIIVVYYILYQNPKMFFKKDELERFFREVYIDPSELDSVLTDTDYENNIRIDTRIKFLGTINLILQQATIYSKNWDEQYRESLKFQKLAIKKLEECNEKFLSKNVLDSIIDNIIAMEC